MRAHLRQVDGLDGGAVDEYRKHRQELRMRMNRLKWAVLAALVAVHGPAAAIVGGAQDESPLARSSLMVLSSKGGVCSAVVVARDVVLTAGHCVTGAPEHRVHWMEAGVPVLVKPTAKALHPGYDPKAIKGRRRSIDLALVRVPEPLPDRFEIAALTGVVPPAEAGVTVGGWGVTREGDIRSTGTFRTAALRAVAPYGPSRILLWAEGDGAGACQGDSGGILSAGGTVTAITSWSSGAGRRTCGALTQGILLGPQREWIDRILQDWGRTARWE
jgi:hypothetical protein